MLTVQCDDLGREVMISPRDVTATRATDTGVLVSYRCWCGQPGVLLTGKNAVAEKSGHVEAAA